MRSLILLSIYTITWLVCFLIVSIPASWLFSPYYDVITSVDWFIASSIFLCWWVALIPTRAFYLKYYHYYKP